MSTSPGDPAAALTVEASPAARVSAVLFGLLATFQTALAFGAPWGAAAWGGMNAGTLPVSLRIASAVSALVWAGIAVLVGSRVVRAPWRRRMLTVLLVLMAISFVMNLASPSGAERLVWALFAAVQCFLIWKARRDEAA